MKNYPALSMVIGERDGVDGSRHLWMTYSINRIYDHSRCLGIVLVIGDVGLNFL